MNRHLPRPLSICHQCRTITRESQRRRRQSFPHGLSDSEHLVPPSKDGSTPITDSLPRSVLLDPTTYKNKHKPTREKPGNIRGGNLLSKSERAILANPYAHLLASPIRQDAFAHRVLPTSLLVKFALFRHEGERKWLLPANIEPIPAPALGETLRGRYRVATKNAIDEFAAYPRRWMVLAQSEAFSDKKANIVWRDGMGEYILELLREAAWKRVDGLSRRYFFEVDVDEDLTMATVGKIVEKRKRPRKVTGKGTGESVELGQGQSQVDGKVSTASTALPSTATMLRHVATNILLGQRRSISIEVDHTNHQSTLPIDKITKQTHISAIFYLGPPEMKDSWEYKLIDIENQTTQATLFNIRRLFPYTAELYFTRFGALNAVAVQASVLHVTTVLYHMVRLANYLEGAETANLTVEERTLWNQKEKEREREERTEKMRNPR